MSSKSQIKFDIIQHLRCAQDDTSLTQSPKAAIAGAERVLDIRTQSCQFRPTICI